MALEIMTFMLPFLFVLAIVYGALELTSVLKNKAANIVIALVVAFFAISNASAVEFIIAVMPWAAILFIAAFFARVATIQDFATNMLNFLAFGLGIGAPLLAFSLVSRSASRWMVNALVKYNRQIDFVAGLIMVGVALYYLINVFHVFDFLT